MPIQLLSRPTALAALLLLACGCTKNARPEVQSAKCTLKPEVGPCRAAVPRYYFDQTDRKCKEFIWGGCGGVVPFETLQECLDCGCK